MSSSWPPQGGAGQTTGGYGADDFGIDPDYPSDTGHYANGDRADQDQYDWQGATQSYTYADDDSSGYGIAAYEGEDGSQDRYGTHSYDYGTYGQSSQGQPAYGHDQYDQSSYEPGTYEPGVRGQGQYEQGQYEPGQHGQGQYEPGQYGQGQYGQGQYGQGQYGQGQYEQGQYGQGPRELTRYERGAYDGQGYGQQGYEQQPYEQQPYEQPNYSRDPYGQATGSSGSYYQAPYDGTGYASTSPADGSAYSDSGYGNGSYGNGSYGNGSYGNGSYGDGSYGDGAGTQQASGRAGNGVSGYGGEGERGTDSYGREPYAQEGYGSARSYGGTDTGSFGRPDTGSFDAPDSGVFARPDQPSFDERDSVAFPRPEPGSFGQPQPGAYGRSSSFQGRGRASGYEPWHDAEEDGDGWEGDESDGDWHDEGDSSLLSRLSGDDDDVADAGGRGSRRRSKKAKGSRRGRGRVALLAAVLATALVVGAIGEYGYHVYSKWHTTRYGDYSGTGYGKVRFTVPQNAALSDLGPALVKAGVIMEVRPFVSAANAATGANTLQPGVYVLHHHMSAADAVGYLLSSAHRLNDVVRIIEGTRASAIAKMLAKQTHLPVSEFTKLIDDPSKLGVPSWASSAKNAEGFLFPDTYDILPHESALTILRAMVAEFNQQVNGINLATEAKKVNTDAWHVLIVASLVQAEAGSQKDFGKIARVVWNRLAANMPLEFDSTVFYAMGIYGTAINAKQEKFNSPYNTYQHTGLPPGPIGNPGIAAIQATLHPPHGDWLYFITDTRHKPYQTHFTNSLTQLQTWQREFGN